jgi:tetratricopeptide (TPR) repeat protein
MKHYYYAVNDQQFGPFTVDELKTKRLKKSTLVWTEGMEKWASANDIEELKDILIPEPPPLPKKTTALPIDETIQIKQPPTPVTSTKYDLTYKKETETTIIGVLLLVIPIVLKESKVFTFEIENSYNQARFFLTIASLVLRIFVSIWVVNIAYRQNRNSKGWGWFAFFLPSIALIVIGQLKKLRLKIELDGSLPAHQKVDILLEKANQLFSKNRHSECIEILNKAIEIDDQNYECIKLRGLAHYQMKNYDNAKSDFKNLIKSQNFHSIANFILGDIELNNFNRELAIEYWLEATKYDNADAKIKLDMYHNFTHKYLINNNQIQKKLGLKFDPPIFEYGVTKYEEGLPILDNDLKQKSKKVQINNYKNGIDLEFREIFKLTHIAIAFYEIDNIVYKEMDKLFELHLTDKNILTLNYDQSKDNSNGLKKLCNKFKQETGKTPDASSSWKD